MECSKRGGFGCLEDSVLFFVIFLTSPLQHLDPVERKIFPFFTVKNVLNFNFYIFCSVVKKDKTNTYRVQIGPSFYKE